MMGRESLMRGWEYDGKRLNAKNHDYTEAEEGNSVSSIFRGQTL